MNYQNCEMNLKSHFIFGRYIFGRSMKQVASFAVVLFAVAVFSSIAQAATFHVTTTADNNNNANPTAGSLRKAILDANANAGTDTIDFNIPGAGVHTITVTLELPPIDDPVVIDGYTQSGSVQNTLANTDIALLMIQITGTSTVKQGLWLRAGSSTVRGLIINGFLGPNNLGNGIVIESKNGNVIAGNFIGVDANGTNQVPNGTGIEILGSSNNVIGGTQAAARNLISGNKWEGIDLQNSAYHNVIEGNFIGTNRGASGALGNGHNGIRFFNCGSANSAGTVGGTTAGAGNVISGNAFAGIQTAESIFGLHIEGNLIGTDVTGKIALGNTYYGIDISSIGDMLLVGGASAEARNIISGNGYNGVVIDHNTATKLLGNYIGTDITGKKALQNKSTGVVVLADNNNIGGSGPQEGNVISGNGSDGIYISGLAANQTTGSGNSVQGNFIGVGADAITALGNYGAGVSMSVPNGGMNVVGGQGEAENIIGYNGHAGVQITGGGKGNLISHNSIRSNGGLGIALDILTPLLNDAGDVDTGSNNRQNYPVLNSASLINNGTTVFGSLNSTPNTSFTLEFFANDAPDQSGYGEGQKYVGSLGLGTGASGNIGFSLTLPGLSAGQCLSATATDSTNNTSEFSLCQPVVVNAPGNVQLSSATYSVSENGGTATVTAKRTGGTFGTVTVQYATVAGGTATAGTDYTASSGVLSWGNGDSADKTFTVPIKDNGASNPNKTVNLSLSNPTNGATLGNPTSAVLTIVDDESVPKVSINDVSQMEGNSGTTNFVFTVSLSAASSQTIKVDYTTNDVTTNTPADYLANIGTLTFAPGQTSKQIAVAVNGDTQFEPDETFTVTLSNVVNAVGSKVSGLGTIINDDAKPSGLITVNFGQATYNVQEDLTALNVTVTRSGDSSVTSSVDYTTIDGTAKQQSDFEYAAGTLTFAPGETDKTISVLINEDMFVEGNETFSLVLTNPIGTLLGPQGTTTVTIVDDPSEPLTSPIDDAQAFVHMHYHDFLNREPDAEGLNFWTSQITACGADAACADAARANVSTAFYLSIEFQQTGYLLYLMNKASYGTMPHYALYMRDLQTLGRGVVVNTPGWEFLLATNQQNLADDWVNRPEFKARFDNMSNTDFVNALYANAGIVPPQTDKDAMLARLDTASERRSNALLDVANNAAFRQQEQNAGFVLMEYFGYLRRNPDASPDSDLSGYNFWLNKLNQFGGNYLDAEMVKAFIASKEYRQRFGQ